MAMAANSTTIFSNAAATAADPRQNQGFCAPCDAVLSLIAHRAGIQVIGRQLLRSGTSVAANYRAALRGRSRQEFAAKIGIVREEADESLFWLELLHDSGLVKPELPGLLLREARELTAIFTTSYETAKKKSAL